MRTSQKLYLPFKRLIGIFGSLIGIILCFVFLWWWVIPINAVASGGHPFFKQYRCGKNSKPFPLIKFRSMRVDAPSHETSEHIDNPDKYVTKFGKFLRRTSIDETPQLLNIFVGQMAFIGPRPLIYEDKETIEERRKNNSIKLKPGLSGLAQVSGRVNLDPISKGQMDGEYYNKINFWLDAKIFFKTIGQVLKSKDVSKK